MPERSPKPQQETEAPLEGLKQYLGEHQLDSVFDRESGKDGSWVLFLHENKQVAGKITENETYEFQLLVPDGSLEKIHKVKVNYLCKETDLAEVLKQVKKAGEQKPGTEGPHFSPRYRHHIKNKSLYPLMNRKEVLFFTLLGGEVVRGIIEGFSRFEIYLNMKRGVPVILLRHAILDVRDKKDRSYLKKAVEKSGKYW